MTDLGGLADDIDRLINSVYTENECKGDFYFIVKLLILYVLSFIINTSILNLYYLIYLYLKLL